MTASWTPVGTLTAGGKSLEYTCYGPAPSDAPTLVLLHEGLGCVALWKDFPEALAKATGMGVFVYSRAGYGQSEAADLPRPADYMSIEAIEVLPQVLDAIGFERGILVGHSDGATIAAIYAGSVADYRVRSIVLMAPHFFTEEMGLAEIARATVAFETTDLRARLAKYHRDPDNAFLGWSEVWLRHGSNKWNIADVIDHFRIPTLAIQGVGDEYGTIAQIEEVESRAYSPVDTLILNNCKHSPFVDQRAVVTAEISEHCARLQRIEMAKVVGF